jgi:hypothetical protein
MTDAREIISPELIRQIEEEAPNGESQAVPGDRRRMASVRR